MKKIFAISMSLFLAGCSNVQTKVINDSTAKDAHTISFQENEVLFDGNKVNEYDYVWHVDPSNEDEYYTGTEPKEDLVYVAHDIVYYPEIDESQFELINYDGEMEWATYYTKEEINSYIFSTLPNLNNEFPSQMMHSEAEAYDNPVLHINQAGEYILEGKWKGQIKIDLGEDAFEDENEKVTIYLNSLDVTCTVAPAILFNDVYECDNTWESRESYSNDVDISEAGAKVVIMDGTENNVTGANVFRLLKPTYKKEGSNVQKKRYKMDGAFYSFESLLITGEEKGTGILNITSTTYEGLDSELHLQIDSGNINIVSQDDGINVNEDNVSAFIMNGGRLTIFAGQGAEGDVIDSNGYITINGGTILGTSPSVSDEILDSDKETIVSDSATVISSGAMRNNINDGFKEPDNESFNFQNMPTPLDGEQPFDSDDRPTPPDGEQPPEKPF